jgi:hypothetical protein
MSLRALAALHGIKSYTTIRRWIDAENWKRDIGAITAGLVTRSVARGATPAEQQAQDAQDAPRHDLPIDCHLAPPTVSAAEAARKRMMRKTARFIGDVPEARRAGSAVHGGGASVSGGKPDEIDYEPIPGDPACAHPPHGEHSGDRTPSTGRKTHYRVAARRIEREIIDTADLATARGLAELHARAIIVQNRMAEKMMQTGSELLDHVRTLLSDEDVDVRGVALQALTAVNIDKDTLAGIVKAASQTIREGMTLQRKALGMDLIPPNTQQPAAGGDVPDGRSEQQKFLDMLPPDVLSTLRDTFKARSMERPDAVDTMSAAARERAAARGSLLPPSPPPPAPPDEGTPPGDA